MIFRAALASLLVLLAPTGLTAPAAGAARPETGVDRSHPYAFLQGDTVLVLGNAAVERRFRWNGGNLMTLSLEDRTSGTLFRTVRPQPDFVFTRNASAPGALSLIHISEPTRP